MVPSTHSYSPSQGTVASYLVLPVLLGFGVEKVGKCSDSWPHFACEDVATVVLCQKYFSWRKLFLLQIQSIVTDLDKNIFLYSIIVWLVPSLYLYPRVSNYHCRVTWVSHDIAVESHDIAVESHDIAVESHDIAAVTWHCSSHMTLRYSHMTL